MDQSFFRHEKFFFNDTAFLLFLMSFLVVFLFFFLFYKLFFKSLLTQVWEGKPRQLTKSIDIATCNCTICSNKPVNLENKSANSGWLKYLVVLGLLLVCSFLGYLVWSIPKERLVTESVWNPFDILGVTEKADEKEIARAFRKLSLRYHPDKNPDDPLTVSKFIDIQRAYETLTNVKSRENFIKFGNPDGFQGVTYGIGLPKALKKYDKPFLVIYLVVLVVGIPLGVGTWWKRSSQVLENGVKKNSVILFRQMLIRTGTFKDLVGTYASAFEFEHLVTKKLFPFCVQLMNELKNHGHSDFRKLKLSSLPHMVFNQVILQAYICRIPIPEELKSALEQMIAKMDLVISAMIDTNATILRREVAHHWPVGFGGGFASRILSVLQVSQSLCQQLHPRDSELLQVPLFDHQLVQRCRSKEFKIHNIQELCRLPQSKLENLLRDWETSQITKVKMYLDRFPILHNMQVTEPFIEDEEDSRVFEGDVLTIKVTFQVLRYQGSSKGSEERELTMGPAPCLFHCPLQNLIFWIEMPLEPIFVHFIFHLLVLCERKVSLKVRRRNITCSAPNGQQQQQQEEEEEEEENEDSDGESDISETSTSSEQDSDASSSSTE
ncbi:Translocation protein SEC63 [Galdieria sulphuraria]|nr:Translocation protein SEC63 [Galdieria sulphuraria]